MIQLKRVYDPAASSDGARFLIERLWPRGIRKENLPFQAWLKDVAPSSELRKWFSHDPAKWQQFQRRYLAELRRRPGVLRPVLDAAASGHRVTLLYSSHDSEHNNAVVLKSHLDALLHEHGPATRVA